MADPIAQRARNTPGGVAAGFEGKHHVQRTAQLDLHRWQCIRRVHVRTVAQPERVSADSGASPHLPALAGVQRKSEMSSAMHVSIVRALNGSIEHIATWLSRWIDK